MPQTSWPFVDAATSDVEYSTLFKHFQDNGVVGDLDGEDLLVYANSSGLNVKVLSGDAFIRGYYYQNTEPVITLPIDPSTGSLRADRVVLRLNVAAPNAADRIKLDIVKGTTSIPTPLVQDPDGIWEESLGVVNVAANTPNIAANAVRDDRSFIGMQLGRWPDDAHRPPAPIQYKIGYNAARGYIEQWTGDEWIGLPSNFEDLANLPTTFPPSAHTHSWASITGKPTTFTPSSHTHTTAQITDYDGVARAKFYTSNDGYTGGAILSGGDSATGFSFTVTVPAGKIGIIRAFAKAFLYGTSSYAGYLRILRNGTGWGQAYRFHNHSKAGPRDIAGAWSGYELGPGTYTILVRYTSDSNSNNHEFWDFYSDVTVEWAQP